MTHDTTCRRGVRKSDPAELVVRAAEKAGVEPDHVKSDRPGFIYVLQSGPWFKIGHTVDLGRRLKELRIQLPFKAYLVYAAEVPQVKSCESLLHGMFAESRVNGEWFALTDADWRVLEAWMAARVENGRRLR